MEGWALAIGIFVLLQGVGKFLDEYHIQSTTKDKAREVLRQGFTWLDSVRVPRVPSVALNAIIYATMKNQGRYAIPCALMFTAIGTVYFREYEAVPLLVRTVFTVFVFWGGFRLFGRFYFRQTTKLRKKWLRKAAFVLVVTSFSFAVYCISYPLHGYWVPRDFREIFLSPFAAAMAPVPILVAFCIAGTLVVVKIAVGVIRWIALTVFRAASRPESSPFQYFASLLGTLTLITKFVLELE